ncbi:MAG: PmoA family protein [Bacteroidales bacterium]|nr:PmoA family protein [Bacteroidales bacterium]
MNYKTSSYLLFLTVLISCNSTPKGDSSSFLFRETGQGVELLDGEAPVLFYQKVIKSPNGEYFINNYIHPLYSLSGDTLTEEFPKDHLHHRGIFWAWHQVYIGNQNVGDGWIMENVSYDVVSVETSKNKSEAQLKTHVLWKSLLFQDSKPFIEEHTTITIFKAKENFRIIDFEILLKPLVSDVFLGGSDNEKGYGGFSWRTRLPEDAVFTSSEGPVTPQTLQIEAGPWMDLSASFEEEGMYSGLSVLCHPSTPNYVAPWILRQQKSMQNIIFPGRDKVKLSMDKPTVLRYRLIVHNGRANDIDIANLQLEYDKIDFPHN